MRPHTAERVELVRPLTGTDGYVSSSVCVALDSTEDDLDSGTEAPPGDKDTVERMIIVTRRAIQRHWPDGSGKCPTCHGYRCEPMRRANAELAKLVKQREQLAQATEVI